MAWLTDDRAEAQWWRIEALLHNRPAVAGGPLAGEVNALHNALKALSAKVDAVGTVDVAALVKALVADPAFRALLVSAAKEAAPTEAQLIETSRRGSNLAEDS